MTDDAKNSAIYLVWICYVPQRFARTQKGKVDSGHDEDVPDKCAFGCLVELIELIEKKNTKKLQ